MAEVTEDLVIRQNDPFYTARPHLDFQVLRKEGLEHLGELSGKIWTDHNIHDPGISILEILCYALIDLGYRATLPIEDLLSQVPAIPSAAGDFAEDDNFFTPLEILSCNPTTIADYRKLLLEVDGVRNAWLKPAKTTDSALYLLGNSKKQTGTNHYRLTCQVPPEAHPTRIDLNGLYRVLIEKEPSAADDAIFAEVQTLLSANRNLCEDFQDVVVLCPLEVGVCLDLEIEKTADAALVYGAVLEAIQSYIAPRIQYYTLRQLLDKGKAIEDIFTGRPFMTKSVGFVDIDELKSLPLRKELYASDLYRIIKEITGVVAIRDLLFQTDAATASNGGGNIQRLRVPDRYIAAFSLDRTCVQLRGAPHFDKEKIHKRLALGGKARFERKDLDLPIPQGRFNPELSEYDSVQREFPSVYGLAEGGLPADATPLRKLQALQLKGYLLFYDQLLANYLAQMANVRSMFSLRQESTRDPSERHTYFGHGLERVPGLQKLLRSSASNDLVDGSILAVPVANDRTLAQKLKELTPTMELSIEDSCGARPGALAHLAHATAPLREVSIRQSMRDLAQGDYQIEIYEDKGGHFFILRFTQVSTWLLIGYLRYRDAAEAREAANFAAFLATRPNYYRKSSQQNQAGIIDYRYDLVTNLTADADYLQHLLENEELYQQRREAFLDHLLARFANQFTDYALLQYKSTELSNRDRLRAIEDKSRFLSHFDELSRNRGRAFNYLEPSWGTQNVSGYELRVSMLAGISDWTRRRLCKFEVVRGYPIEMNHANGESRFSSKADDDSKGQLENATNKVKGKVSMPESYNESKNQLEDFDAEKVGRTFSELPAGENVEVSQSVYALELRDSKDCVRQESTRKDYALQSEAVGGLARFLEEIKSGESGLELVETWKGRNTYFDRRQLRLEIQVLNYYRWHQYDEQGERSGGSETTFTDRRTAIMDLVQNGDWRRYIATADGFRWLLSGAEGAVSVISSESFRDPNAAIEGLLEAIEAAKAGKNFQAVVRENRADYRIELRASDGTVLGRTPTLSADDAKARHAVLQALRKEMKRLLSPVTDEAEQYRWRLRAVADGEVVLESAQALSSQEEAGLDFAESIRQIAKGDPNSNIGQQFYSVTPVELPVRYRFVFCVNSAGGKASPILRSQREFESRDEAEKAYTEFVRAQPRLQRAGAVITDGSDTAAVLTEDTEENRKTADALLAYKHQQYAAGDESSPSPAYIYRLVDRDHPIARAVDCYETEDAAEEALANVCGFAPYRTRCENEVIRIICPALDPGRFHYAVCFADDAGKEFLFLVSYRGFESREAAQQAGEANWLPLIELATDRSHYGEGKQIALEDTYGVSTDVYSERDLYVAVLAKEYRDRVDEAVELAKRYPIRIAYKEDKHGNPTTERHGYYFQGYDLKSEKTIWKSAQTYSTPKEALEAYQVFVIVLRNRNSCRVVCEGGRYCIHLLEILAESKKQFETELDAWGEPQRTAKDACGELVCRNDGVRLFTEAAIADAAFIPQDEKGCFYFTVVDHAYHVARHTCSYPTAEARDQALKEIYDLSSSIRPDVYEQTLQPGAEPNEFVLRYHIGEGYFFESIRAFPASDWEQPDIARMVDRWFDLARRSANYQESGGAWYLCDPFAGRAGQGGDNKVSEKGDENGVRVAALKREAAAGAFRIDDFKRLARKYPVFKKGDDYCFRLYFPENGGALDEELQRCCCESPKSNEQTARFCGHPYIFEGAQSYACRAAAEEAFGHFCILLQNLENYQSEAESGLGPYTFGIVDPKKVLATHPHCHTDAADAMRAIERARACINDEGMHLVEHILLRPQAHRDDAACECLLPVCPDFACTLTWEDDLDEDDPCAATENPPLECIPGADPYSFWATLVLPGWNARFSTKETRQFFKEMLYREVPAMVGLNILWLSPMQMCAFDDAFRDWLDWHRRPEAVCAGRENALCRLVDCIKNFRNDPPCPGTETESTECDCLPKADEPLDDCLVRTEQLFWSECGEEDHPIDLKNEADQPGSPEARTNENVHAGEEGEGVTLDPAAIRQTIAQRADTYRENVRAAADERTKATESYERAEFFIDKPPALGPFRKLVTQILDKEFGSLSTVEGNPFVAILRNATWYLLDKLVLDHPREVAEEVRLSLSEVLAAMKGKGVNLSAMGRDWKIEALEKVMPAPAIRQYLRLLDSA